MATKGDQIRNLVKAFGGTPRQSTIEDAIEDLVGLFSEKVEVEMVEFLPEMEVTTTEGSAADGAGAYDWHEEGVHVFSEGETYIVHFDGKKYTCVARCLNTGDDIRFLIGNGELGGDDIGTNEPFMFMNFVNGGEQTDHYMCFQEPGTHTISVSQIRETVTPPVVSLPRVEKKMVEIVPEQSFTITEDMMDGEPVKIAWYDIDHPDFVEGNVYFVYFNGIRYECVAKYDGEFAYIGDEGIWMGYDKAADYPFAIGDGVICVRQPDTYALAIYEEQEVVKPLDPKFVGGGARGFDMIIYCDWGSHEARLAHGDYTTVKRQLDEYGFAIIGISEGSGSDRSPFAFCASIENNDDTIVVYNFNMGSMFTIYPDNSVDYNDIG